MQCRKLCDFGLALMGIVMLTSCSLRGIPSNTFLSPVAPGTMHSPLAIPAAATTGTPVQPTNTPAAAKAGTSLSPISTPTVSGPCIAPDQLEDHLGDNVCVRGKVLATDNWKNDFVMWLSQNPATLYIVVRNTFYLGVEGGCLQVTGVVQRDGESRTFIRADEPGQVSPCEE
jgi:hypothetical protein